MMMGSGKLAGPGKAADITLYGRTPSRLISSGLQSSLNGS